MVTLNDRLDYFGSTVNVAARVSSLVQGAEMAFTRPVQAAGRSACHGTDSL
jgi:class 3 adenylate cyclase